MSTFNPDAFLNTTVTDSNSTTATPVPEGEHVASIKDIKVRTTSTGKAVLDVVWSLDSPEATAVTGIANPTVRQSIFLDITESGGLDVGKGKNVQLGKLREALKQNQSGKTWQPGMLIGGVARVNVKHRPGEGEELFADVKSVVAM